MSPSGDSAEPALPTVPAFGGPRGRSAARTPFAPATRWVAERQINALCLAVAIVSPLASLWMLSAGTANLRAGVWSYSVDGAGTIHYGPVRQADAESALFREILLQAAQACLTRNPSGLSYPEVAKRIFVDGSWQSLEADLAAELPERKRRNLYDHPEVEGIELVDGGSTQRFRIRGFIVRTGAVDGLPYQPPPGEFHLIVELAPQPDALQQGRYPFVVVRHRCTLRWPGEIRSR